MGSLKCHAQGHNKAVVVFEPPTSCSEVPQSKYQNQATERKERTV